MESPKSRTTVGVITVRRKHFASQWGCLPVVLGMPHARPKSERYGVQTRASVQRRNEVATRGRKNDDAEKQEQDAVVGKHTMKQRL
jgi:hypothetical protein